MIIAFGFFLAFVVQGLQGADHYEKRTRHTRRSVLTDTELKSKLDSIVSLLGKLNDKIDSQEQRIAVLSRQVSNINCNGEQRKGKLKAQFTNFIVAPFILRKTKELYCIFVLSLHALSIT